MNWDKVRAVRAQYEQLSILERVVLTRELYGLGLHEAKALVDQRSENGRFPAASTAPTLKEMMVEQLVESPEPST